MICDKCNEAGDLKIFDSFQYYYCMGCREEIKLMTLRSPPAILDVPETEDLPASLDWLF